MNKDALLATLIGFGIGLFITGIFLLGPNALKGLPSLKLPTFQMPSINFSSFGKKPNPTPTTAVTGTTQTPSDLSIDSPLADMIETKSDLLVSGKTTPNASVVIEGEIDEIATTASADGAYAGKIKLVEGKNTITVTSVTPEKEVTKTVSLYFTEEKL